MFYIKENELNKTLIEIYFQPKMSDSFYSRIDKGIVVHILNTDLKINLSIQNIQIFTIL